MSSHLRVALSARAAAFALLVASQPPAPCASPTSATLRAIADAALRRSPEAPRRAAKLRPDDDRTPVGASIRRRRPKVALLPPAPPPRRWNRSVSRRRPQLYRKGAAPSPTHIAGADRRSAERAALEWLALRASPRPTALVSRASRRPIPDWPDAAGSARSRRPRSIRDMRRPPRSTPLFAADPPQTPPGVLASPAPRCAEGRAKEGEAVVRALWRDHDLDAWTEGAVLREFGALLTRADHKYRADRLLYAEKAQAALRAAELAGPDVVALAARGWRPPSARCRPARSPPCRPRCRPTPGCCSPKCRTRAAPTAPPRRPR